MADRVFDVWFCPPSYSEWKFGPSCLWVVKGVGGSFSLPSYVTCSTQWLLSTKHFLAAYSSSLPHSHAWLCLTLELGWDVSPALDAYSEFVHLNESFNLSWLLKSNFTWNAPQSDKLFPQQYDLFWDFCKNKCELFETLLNKADHWTIECSGTCTFCIGHTLKTSMTYSCDISQVYMLLCHYNAIKGREGGVSHIPVPFSQSSMCLGEVRGWEARLGSLMPGKMGKKRLQRRVGVGGVWEPRVGVSWVWLHCRNLSYFI